MTETDRVPGKTRGEEDGMATNEAIRRVDTAPPIVTQEDPTSRAPLKDRLVDLPVLAILSDIAPPFLFFAPGPDQGETLEEAADEAEIPVLVTLASFPGLLGPDGYPANPEDAAAWKTFVLTNDYPVVKQAILDGRIPKSVFSDEQFTFALNTKIEENAHYWELLTMLNQVNDRVTQTIIRAIA